MLLCMPGVGCVTLDRIDGALEPGELSAQGVRYCRGGPRRCPRSWGWTWAQGVARGQYCRCCTLGLRAALGGGSVCRADSLWPRRAEIDVLYIWVNIATVPRNAAFNVYSPPWCLCFIPGPLHCFAAWRVKWTVSHYLFYLFKYVWSQASSDFCFVFEMCISLPMNFLMPSPLFCCFIYFCPYEHFLK